MACRAPLLDIMHSKEGGNQLGTEAGTAEDLPSMYFPPTPDKPVVMQIFAQSTLHLHSLSS